MRTAAGPAAAWEPCPSRDYGTSGECVHLATGGQHTGLDIWSLSLSLSLCQGVADDGRSVLLRCRLLHPQEDVPVTAEGRAGLQCIFHQASRQLSRSALFTRQLVNFPLILYAVKQLISDTGPPAILKLLVLRQWTPEFFFFFLKQQCHFASVSLLL